MIYLPDALGYRAVNDNFYGIKMDADIDSLPSLISQKQRHPAGGK